MNNKNKARKYTSTLIENLLRDGDPIEMEKTKNKMLIAARIDDILNEIGLKKNKFAQKVGKKPSEITKWLSGTQNFTIEILVEIAYALEVNVIDLISAQEAKTVNKTKYVYTTIIGSPKLSQDKNKAFEELLKDLPVSGTFIYNVSINS